MGERNPTSISGASSASSPPSSTRSPLRKFYAGFRLDRVTSQNIRGGSACTYNVLISNLDNRPIAISGADPAPGEPSFRTSVSARS
jgi:hypothetical protein